jgi:acyl dehydratase
MTIPHYSMATAAQFVGRELGISDWTTADQARIQAFAACTGDRQWIHVDVDRARHESPFGGPVAHGYLTLALVAAMVLEIGVVPSDARRRPLRTRHLCGRARGRRRRNA